MSDDLQEWVLSAGGSERARRVYRATRWCIRQTLHPLYQVEIRNPERLDLDGPVILAPVHRSHLDAPIVAAFSSRRIRALAKKSLFANKPVGWFLAALGAFPVRRGEADRDALLAAKRLLDQGEAMIVFPEGTRQTGDRIGALFDGPAYLAAKTGATVLPIGVAGTEAALPSGAKYPRRTRIAVVVGEPMEVAKVGGRVSRDERKRFTERLSIELQAVMDQAVADRAATSRAKGATRDLTR